MVKDTGIGNTTPVAGSENAPDTKKYTNELRNNSGITSAPIDYDEMELLSVQAMKVLSGFAPLGMLFVLMEILNGAEEGLIRVNRLAETLSISKTSMLAQLEHLENAGLIRTISSSQHGRHVELLVPNIMLRKNIEAVIHDEASLSTLNAIPDGAPPNFSLDTLSALQSYLTDRGIRIAAMHDDSGDDRRVPPIAAFMGKNLSCVMPFYTRLKATLNSGDTLQFSLSGFSGRNSSHILNFCRMLKDAGLLTVFSYRRAPHCVITAQVGRAPAAINFLSGGWLEYYIRDKVSAVLTTHPATMDMPFAFMKNPRIILPGNENFEFDFLLMVKDRVFWIEAKTGDYLNYLGKYSRVSKLLELNRNSSLLVIVGAPKPDANVSARFGISCCGVDEFQEVFRLCLIRELGSSRKRG